MGSSLQDKMASLSPERQARIREETARLQAEYMTIQDLRKARELTQTRLGELLGKNQVTIAQMEKRHHLRMDASHRAGRGAVPILYLPHVRS